MTALRRKISWGWWIAFGITLLLVSLATLPPFVGPELRGLLLVAFSGVCHQIAERSPHISGVTLAVCHRCYGIYLALPVAALIFRFAGRWDARLNRWAPTLLAFSVIIPGVDWLGDILSIWTNTPISRMLTGAVFGLAGGYFLSRALTQAFGPKEGATPDDAGPQLAPVNVRVEAE